MRSSRRIIIVMRYFEQHYIDPTPEHSILQAKKANPDEEARPTTSEGASDFHARDFHSRDMWMKSAYMGILKNFDPTGRALHVMRHKNSVHRIQGNDDLTNFLFPLPSLPTK